MAKIIADITAVFSEVSFKNLKFILPFKAAIVRAPKAPIAEASVGVAIPANIDPRTRKINAIGRARVFNNSVFSIEALFE